MRFNGTITPGDILIAITMAVSVFGAYNRLTNQLTKLGEKLDPVYNWWDRHVNNVGDSPTTRQAKQMGD